MIRLFSDGAFKLAATSVLVLVAACNSRPTYDIRVMRLHSDCAGDVHTTLVHDPDPEVKSLSVDAQSVAEGEAEAIWSLTNEGYDLVVGFDSGVTCRFAFGEAEGACYDTASEAPVLCDAKLDTTGWRWPSQGPGYTVPRAVQQAHGAKGVPGNGP